MKAPKRRSGHPAGAAADARPTDSRISLAAGQRWLLAVAVGGAAIFLLVLFVGHAEPGIGGFLGHLAMAFGLSIGFIVSGGALLAAGMQKTTETSWLIVIVLGAVAVCCVVFVVQHADPDPSGWFDHLGLALGFAYGFVFITALGPTLLGLDATSREKRVRGPLGPVLEELEKVRRQAQRATMPLRLLLSAIGVGAGFALGHWAALLLDYEPFPVEFLGALVGVGGGPALGLWRQSNAYANLYNARVLPLVIGGASEFSYQIAPTAQFQPLQALFQSDALAGGEALVGARRGLPVVVAQLVALRGGSRGKSVFEGLVVAVTLKNRLAGDTVVIPAPAKDKPRWARPPGLQAVGLEDLDFERAYDAYSGDQVMARALLTPAFMERFLSLPRSGRFGQPLCLGHANQLFVALPTSMGMFHPPDFDESARFASKIEQLQRDLADVLGVVDAVIDLDTETRVAASPAPQEP